MDTKLVVKLILQIIKNRIPGKIDDMLIDALEGKILSLVEAEIDKLVLLLKDKAGR